MLKDRLKSMLQGNALAASVSNGVRPMGTVVLARQSAVPSHAAQTRQSHGLDQFFGSMRGQEGLSVLDFAGASQANISFITNLGHRLYSEDFLRSLDSEFGGDGDFYENQSDRDRAHRFLAQALDFPEASFDAALVWDSFQYLAPSLLESIVERLHRVLRPSGCMLAFFHSDERATSIPSYFYRISDSKTLLLTPRGPRKPAQFFNNRSLERLFQRFASVKFFLTRGHLREVIVTR